MSDLNKLANAFGKTPTTGLVTISPKGGVTLKSLRMTWGGLTLRPEEWVQVAKDINTVIDFMGKNVEAINQRIANPIASKPPRADRQPSARAQLVDSLVQ